MRQIFIITFKGIFRDRVLRGIAMSSLFFLLVPSVSSLSMRQVVELSITLSLSLISVMMLLLSVFLGGSSLWKDMERRYTFSVLGLPVSRTKYLLGKFIGTAAFLFLAALILGAAGAVVVKYVSVLYPPMRPVVWPVLFFYILHRAQIHTPCSFCVHAFDGQHVFLSAYFRHAGRLFRGQRRAAGL